MSDSILNESILEKSNSYACLLSSSGTILSINNRFARIMGALDKKTLVGKKASDSVIGSVELTSFFLNVTDKAELDNEVLVQPIHRNSEKPVWIKFDVSWVTCPDGQPGIYICGIDITAEIHARREAEQRALERSSFLVRMGHELRTPINTVLGYAQLLHGLEGMPPVALEYVRTIINNENNLLHLLSDVLELSKYEAGQTVPLLVETNIKKLVHEVTKSYIDQFSDKYLSLTVDYKTDIPDAILTDPQKLTQILANILGNSLKFTRKGGVTVTVSYTNQLIIDVEDTGIGISSDDSPYLFDVFAQAGSGKEHMTGAGIGLPVARIFARMLGGDVVLLRSNPGVGSTFRFAMEAKIVRSSKTEVPQITDYTQISGISKPCKILLVDDVDINLAMLEIFLSPAGFEVQIAANGFEAVAKYKEFQPDIVFMDLIMPEKDGFEATREIKSYNASVPVVALTASIVDSVKEQALESGVNDFMTKPFIPERLFEIIAEHTGIAYTYK